MTNTNTTGTFVAFGLATAIGFFSVAAAFGQQPTVTEDEAISASNFEQWRDHIRAKTSELDWSELQWLPSFHEGLTKAAAENKPLLLWAMNGHPLGCT